MKNQVNHSVCFHGHFYQPPREDPLTGEIPDEPGAAPFSNWNEMINSQCYRPNAELGNFEEISFNIGPTLAEWLAKSDPLTLQRIIEQDRININRYGVSNAMAQSYNHTILPLANIDDKQTQIRWGIDYFRYRFAHQPAGIWLPETAVDLETLDVLAQNNIQFTLLAPWQARDKSIDFSRPHWVECHEGRKMIVFFYHQDLSTRVSFDPGATANADKFMKEILLPQFNHSDPKKSQDQFLLIASDGEAYGHHHPFRDKFLSYLHKKSLENYPIENSFPARWLQTHMPEDTVEIEANTSWSCFHQLRRWSGICDCTPHSDWKKPLRNAMDAIAEAVNEQYFEVMKTYGVDALKLRNQYIQVINGQISVREYIETHVQKTLMSQELEQITHLLAAQYERQRIFTSCGWFFDDFDRIEPKNNVKYAAQAVWLTYLATGVDLTDLAALHLKKIKSWRSGLTADKVFEQHMDRIHENTTADREKCT